jgi:hypothetical protein
MNNITWSVGAVGYANADDSVFIGGIWIVNQIMAAAWNGQLNRINYMARGIPEEGES